MRHTPELLQFPSHVSKELKGKQKSKILPIKLVLHRFMIYTTILSTERSLHDHLFRWRKKTWSLTFIHHKTLSKTIIDASFLNITCAVCEKLTANISKGGKTKSICSKIWYKARMPPLTVTTARKELARVIRQGKVTKYIQTEANMYTYIFWLHNMWKL